MDFFGDAILALFGAPLYTGDDARRACSCAAAMQAAIVDVDRRNAARGLPPVTMGIGISTGEAIVGHIGSDRRRKYAAVGPTVNLAARIESFTLGGQVLIEEETRQAHQKPFSRLVVHSVPGDHAAFDADVRADREPLPHRGGREAGG